MRSGWRHVLTVIALFGSSLSAFAQATHFNLPPYDGSREHVGVLSGNKPQSAFFYDRRSLVKTWIFKDHEAEAPAPLTPFAEPKSWYNMVGRTDLRSKQTNPPVKVLLMKPGGKAAVWPIGQLPAGTYMFRIIGAIPAADQVVPPKLMTISLTINDQVDPAKKSQYVLRARGVDSFYCVQEFGFHAFDDRAFTAEVSLLDDSLTSLYTYNFEIHDLLAGCAKRAGKTQPSFFTPAERALTRKALAETEEGKKALAEINAVSMKGASEPRLQRDMNLWNSVPGINCHITDHYLTVKDFQAHSLKVDYALDPGKGKWWMLNRIYGSNYGSGWDQKFELAYEEMNSVKRRPIKAADTYSLQDWLAHKPLGATGDRGWGVLNGGVLEIPSARINMSSWAALVRQISPKAADRYYLNGDASYARDAALLLARFAWELPTFSQMHCVGFLTMKAELPWASSRYYQCTLTNESYAQTYDKLFPFIQGNEELAKAVHRFIPSIQTPEDLIQMLDTHLVQSMAKNVLMGRLEYDNDTADILLNLAIIQGDAQITEPWMETMWTKGVYFYPIGRQPLPHVLSTNTGRDGTSPIGSISYAGEGGPAFEAAKRIDLYMRLGGLSKYDLRDFNRYPEAIAGCYWPLEEAVAGEQYLGIGDVGGPSERYGRFIRPEANAACGWKWTKDPRFAWMLVNIVGRQSETDPEWAEISKAAQGVSDPIMNQRSRVLADWSGILESGVGSPDFRFHRAAAVRVGWGYGHAHNDTLDLRVWAHGLTMLGDLAQRGGYGKPSHNEMKSHNLVQIDEVEQNVHSWVSDLSDLPGVQYLEAQAVPVNPGILKRQTALIDVDGGTPSQSEKNLQLDPAVVTPNSYVFDVCRTKGGETHTFCFHGCVDDMGFEVNVPPAARKVWPRDPTPERQALKKTNPDAQFMRDFRWTRPDFTDPETKKVVKYMGDEFRPNDADWAATVPEDTLQATWRLSRTAEARMIGGERKLGGKVTDPRKYTRLHLLNAKGLRLLHGIIIDKVNAAATNPDYPHYAGRAIYVRKPGSESVFVSLIEPYAGDPFILDRKPLDVQPADATPNGPVAVEVVVNVRRDGAAVKRTDVLFADNSGQPRTIPAHGIAVQGEFAVVQKTAAGIEKAALAHGASLKAGDLEITLQRPEYRAKIVKVNYLTREVTLDSMVPAKIFKGAEVEIADKLRSTCYEVGDVVERDGVSVLKLPKSLELKRGRVTGVKTAGDMSVIENSMGSMAEDGCWVANGDYSKLWRAVVKRDNSQITVQGAAGADDFKPADGDIITLEIGPGMDVVLPAKVSVEKTAEGWSVHSNMAGKVKLPGGGVKDLTPE